MSIFKNFDITASGIYAQKKRMNIIAQNISNADTILTDTNEPYRRKIAVLSKVKSKSSFSKILDDASKHKEDSGVSVSSVEANTDPFKLEYNPDHPLANADGYVKKPNVDVTTEMLELLQATRAYQANVTVFNNSKSIFKKAMEIGK